MMTCTFGFAMHIGHSERNMQGGVWSVALYLRLNTTDLSPFMGNRFSGRACLPQRLILPKAEMRLSGYP